MADPVYVVGHRVSTLNSVENTHVYYDPVCGDLVQIRDDEIVFQNLLVTTPTLILPFNASGSLLLGALRSPNFERVVVVLETSHGHEVRLYEATVESFHHNRYASLDAVGRKGSLLREIAWRPDGSLVIVTASAVELHSVIADRRSVRRAKSIPIAVDGCVLAPIEGYVVTWSRVRPGAFKTFILSAQGVTPLPSVAIDFTRRSFSFPVDRAVGPGGAPVFAPMWWRRVARSWSSGGPHGGQVLVPHRRRGVHPSVAGESGASGHVTCAFGAALTEHHSPIAVVGGASPVVLLLESVAHARSHVHVLRLADGALARAGTLAVPAAGPLAVWVVDGVIAFSALGSGGARGASLAPTDTRQTPTTTAAVPPSEATTPPAGGPQVRSPAGSFPLPPSGRDSASPSAAARLRPLVSLSLGGAASGGIGGGNMGVLAVGASYDASPAMLVGRTPSAVEPGSSYGGPLPSAGVSLSTADAAAVPRGAALIGARAVASPSPAGLAPHDDSVVGAWSAVGQLHIFSLRHAGRRRALARRAGFAPAVAEAIAVTVIGPGDAGEDATRGARWSGGGGGGTAGAAASVCREDGAPEVVPLTTIHSFAHAVCAPNVVICGDGNVYVLRLNACAVADSMHDVGAAVDFLASHAEPEIAHAAIVRRLTQAIEAATAPPALAAAFHIVAGDYAEAVAVGAIPVDEACGEPAVDNVANQPAPASPVAARPQQQRSSWVPSWLRWGAPTPTTDDFDTVAAAPLPLPAAPAAVAARAPKLVRGPMADLLAPQPRSTAGTVTLSPQGRVVLTPAAMYRLVLAPLAPSNGAGCTSAEVAAAEVPTTPRGGAQDANDTPVVPPGDAGGTHVAAAPPSPAQGAAGLLLPLGDASAATPPAAAAAGGTPSPITPITPAVGSDRGGVNYDAFFASAAPGPICASSLASLRVSTRPLDGSLHAAPLPPPRPIVLPDLGPLPPPATVSTSRYFGCVLAVYAASLAAHNIVLPSYIQRTLVEVLIDSVPGPDVSALQQLVRSRVISEHSHNAISLLPAQSPGLQQLALDILFRVRDVASLAHCLLALGWARAAASYMLRVITAHKRQQQLGQQYPPHLRHLAPTSGPDVVAALDSVPIAEVLQVADDEGEASLFATYEILDRYYVERYGARLSTVPAIAHYTAIVHRTAPSPP